MPKIIPVKFIPAESFRSDFKRFLEKKNDFKQKSFLQKIAWKSYDLNHYESMGCKNNPKYQTQKIIQKILRK